MNTQLKSKKIVSEAIISLFILSMFFSSAPLAFAVAILNLGGVNDGPPGTIVPISGSGFASGSYMVYFDTNNNGGWSLSEPYKIVSVGASGTLSTTLTVPSASPGLYYIRADVFPYTSPDIARAPFAVTIAGIEPAEDILEAIEDKLDLIENTHGWTSLAEALDDIKNEIEAGISVDLTPVLNAIADVEGKLWSNEDSLKNETKAIEDTLKSGGSFYTFVNNWFNDIEGKLWSNDDSLKNETIAIQADIGTWPSNHFTDMDNFADWLFGELITDITNTGNTGWTDLASALDNIKDAIGTASPSTPTTVMGKLEDIKSELTGWFSDGGTIEVLVDEVESLLKDTTYGLSALSSDIADIEAKLDSSTYGLSAIKGYVDDINWADITAIKGYVDTMETDLETWMSTNLKTNIDKIWLLTGSSHGWANLAAALDDIKTEVDAIDISGLLTTSHFDSIIGDLDFERASWTDLAHALDDIRDNIGGGGAAQSLDIGWAPSIEGDKKLGINGTTAATGPRTAWGEAKGVSNKGYSVVFYLTVYKNGERVSSLSVGGPTAVGTSAIAIGAFTFQWNTDPTKSGLGTTIDFTVSAVGNGVYKVTMDPTGSDFWIDSNVERILWIRVTGSGTSSPVTTGLTGDFTLIVYIVD